MFEKLQIRKIDLSFIFILISLAFEKTVQLARSVLAAEAMAASGKFMM